MINALFFGTPEFSKNILNQIAKSGLFNFKAIITAPDKLIGRKKELHRSEVKQWAEKENIQILQPEKIDDAFIAILKDFTNIDVVIVVAYGLIIPSKALNLWSNKWINVHPSLLPKYRGASPIQSAILNGEEETGVSIMLMDEKMDHGAILSQQKIMIAKDEMYSELSSKLSNLSAQMLNETIPSYLTHKIKPTNQDHDHASFCKLIKKEDGLINWTNETSLQIYNKYRAFINWPGVFGNLDVQNDKNLLIKFTQIRLEQKKITTSGKFIYQNDELFIAGKDKVALQIEKLQIAGKQEISAKDFINGYLK